jgi:isoleucyl-tRNA synthetase
LNLEEAEISSADIPGWLVTTASSLTVAMDITLSEELKQEGIAREFINRIQNLRKDSGFEVVDKINIRIQKHEALNEALSNFSEHIAKQTLAESVELVEELENEGSREVELEGGIKTLMQIKKNG